MHIPRLSTMPIQAKRALGERLSEKPDADEEPGYPKPRQLVWEPSTWIKPPTKAQLMAGR